MSATSDDIPFEPIEAMFEGIPAEAIRRIVTYRRPISIGAGQYVCKQGEAFAGLAMILPAKASTLPQIADVFWTNSTTARKLRLQRLRAPALLGSAEILQSAPRLSRASRSVGRAGKASWLTSARAVTDVRVVHIPFEGLALLEPQEELRLIAHLGQLSARAFAGGLSILHDAFVDDGTYRLAAWLRQEAAPLSLDAGGGPTIRTMPMSQAEIASQIGLRRDTLNQKLKALEASGVIGVLPSREIVVHDPERLEQLADLAIREDFRTFATMRDIIADEVASGNAFRARNLALDALGTFPMHPELRHQAVLAALRCGAHREARDLLDAFGWDRDLKTILASVRAGFESPRGQRSRLDLDDEEDLDEQELWKLDRRTNERRLSVDIPALAARVAKEEAFSLDPAQEMAAMVASAQRSFERYAGISDTFSDGYSSVNAAAMALLAGCAAEATQYARRAIASSGGRTFWDHATRMEAFLILNEREKALEAARAATATPMTEISRVGMIASTKLQLRRLGRLRGALSSELRDLLRQRSVVYASGHLPPTQGSEIPHWDAYERAICDRIDQAYRDLDVGTVFCAAAAGSDIVFAERALKAGITVHVVLPVPLAEFLERSVAIGDEASRRHWLDRFGKLIEKVTSVTILEEDKPSKTRLSFDEAVFAGNRHAAGLALLKADQIEGAALMVSVSGDAAPGSIAGTARIEADWRAGGRRAVTIACPWRGGSRPAGAQPLPSCFGAVVFVWLAVPGDRDRHQTKSPEFIGTVLGHARDAVRPHLAGGEEIHDRVLAGQMVGVFIVTAALERALVLGDAICRLRVAGSDGLRVVLDFGGVFASGGRLHDGRLSTLRAARDNLELPMKTVMLTDAFAAHARFRLAGDHRFFQIGSQARRPDGSIMSKAASPFYSVRPADSASP